MEVKKIVEGMTAPQVAELIDENFLGLNKEKASKEEVSFAMSNLIPCRGVFIRTENIAKADSYFYELNRREFVSNPYYFSSEIAIPKGVSDVEMKFEKATDAKVGVEFRDSSGNVTGNFANTDEPRGSLIKVRVPNNSSVMVYSYLNEIGANNEGMPLAKFNGITFYYDFRETFKVETIAGALHAETGEPLLLSAYPEYLKTACTTPNYIGYDISDNIEMDVENGESFIVSCYDKNLKYLGYKENAFKYLLADTEYIKITVLKGNYVMPRTLELKMSRTRANWKELKNTGKVLKANYFSYEVFPPYVPYNSSPDSSVQVPNFNRYYDEGFIMLPPNYQPDANGKKTRLILFVHGTNEYMWGQQTESNYSEQMKYLNNMGYAVACCSGLSSKYAPGITSDVTYQNCKISPVGIDCYTAFYRHLMKTYNLYEDGCFIYGKSSGGLMTAWFAMHQTIPVIAAAGLCPSTDMVASDMCCGCSNSEQVRFWLSLFGITDAASGITSTDGLLSRKELEYLISKKDYFVGYDPFSYNSDLDWEAYLTSMAKTTKGTRGGYPRYIPNEAVAETVKNARKYTIAPYKIWHTPDDGAVLYEQSVWFIDMLRRSGSLAELRTMPEGTGRHYCTDTDPSALKEQAQTRYGGVVSVAVAYIEMVYWFERFRFYGN